MSDGLNMQPSFIIYCGFNSINHVAEDYEVVTKFVNQPYEPDLPQDFDINIEGVTPIENWGVAIQIELKCKRHPENPIGLDVS